MKIADHFRNALNWIADVEVENIFLTICLTAGIFFVFVTPIFYVPDEQWHYVRVLQIANGNLLFEKHGNALGASLDMNQAEFVNKAGNNVKLGSLPAKVAAYGASGGSSRFFERGGSTYSPVPYLPQVAGVLVGEIFGQGQAVIFYLSRLFSLFAYAAIVYFAIKMLPFGKWFFLTAALLPMSLALAASVSADQLTIAMSAFVVAYFLKLLSLEEFSRKDQIIVLGLAFVLALLKTPYALVALLFLTIPMKRFGDKRSYLSFLVMLILIIFGVTWLWNTIAGLYGGPAVAKEMFPTVVANPAGQLHDILSHPLGFVKNMLYSLLSQGAYYVSSLIGVLGQGELSLNVLVYYSYIILLATTLLLDNTGKIVVSWLQKFVSLGLFLALILGITLILYVTWTPVGATMVRGVQGRYFIPLTFLLPIVSFGSFVNKVELNKRFFVPFMAVSNFLLLAFVIVSVYHFYN